MIRDIRIPGISQRRVILAGSFVIGMALIALATPAVNASSISYGSFGPVPPGVTFLQVTESSGTDAVPLYGPPTPFVTGLDFDPKGFVATTNGGGGDITDGQLNFTIMAPGGIFGVNVSERGDYTLAGTGTPATQVSAGTVVLATVTEINGVPVPPTPLPAVNASVAFNLVANPGIVQPWSLGLFLNIPPGLGKVTKLDVAINNQLLAISELTSIAFIAKKDFVIQIPNVPEPTTASLILLGGVFAAVWARRKF